MATDDPRPLTRKELAEFLPTQRSIKVFEKLFDLIPSDIIEILTSIESVSNNTEFATSIAQQALKRRSFDIDYIDFKGDAPHSDRPRRLTWSNESDTLNLHHSDGVVQQIGQESFIRFTNSTGVQINRGQVLGLDFVGGVPTDQTIPYIADGTIPTLNVLGVASQDIPNGNLGRLTTLGIVRNIDTTGAAEGEVWLEGDVLYASPSIAGAFTKDKPVSPSWAIPIAIVLNIDAALGQIYVRISLEQSLYYGQFSNTVGTTPALINTAYPIEFDSTGDSNGVTIGTPPSRIEITTSGLYSISVSFQITSASASAKKVWLWFRLNGVDVPRSAVIVTLISNNEIKAPSRTAFYPLVRGDYIEIVWAADSTVVSLTSTPATAFAPSSPACVLTVEQIQH